jgi:hypothetical protein
MCVASSVLRSQLSWQSWNQPSHSPNTLLECRMIISKTNSQHRRKNEHWPISLLRIILVNTSNNISAYLFTPWSTVLLEKLTGLQLVKKFPAFYGTWRSITAFTSAHHLSLSWASLIQSLPYILKIHFNIILTSMPVSPKWITFQQQKKLLTL